MTVFDLRADVKSANILTAAYDTATETLRIIFKNGGIYDYENVPVTEFYNLQDMESPGKYFHAAIREKYKYTRKA